jgi:hypothetical protein
MDARADNSEKQHSNYNQPDNESMKSWVLEQRIRQLELEVLRQDNKLNNLSDKVQTFLFGVYNFDCLSA